MSKTKDKAPEQAAEAVQKPVSTQDVSQVPPAVSGGQETVAAPVVANVINAPNGLNLRSGPEVSFPVRGLLNNGDQVELVDVPAEVAVPGWQPVCCGDVYGWVCSDFLDEPEV